MRPRPAHCRAYTAQRLHGRARNSGRPCADWRFTRCHIQPSRYFPTLSFFRELRAASRPALDYADDYATMPPQRRESGDRLPPWRAGDAATIAAAARGQPLRELFARPHCREDFAVASPQEFPPSAASNGADTMMRRAPSPPRPASRSPRPRFSARLAAPLHAGADAPYRRLLGDSDAVTRRRPPRQWPGARQL